MSWNAIAYRRPKPIPVFEPEETSHAHGDAPGSRPLPWAEIIHSAQANLAAYGYTDAMRLSESNAVDIQLMAELVNYAAKECHSGFYEFKPLLVRRTLELGAVGGWGDDGAFYLFTKEGGVCCFHDPFGELENTLSPEQNALFWPHTWSGVHRQSLAYALVESLFGDGQLLDELAKMTSPPIDDTAVESTSDEALCLNFPETLDDEPFRPATWDEIASLIDNWGRRRATAKYNSCSPPGSKFIVNQFAMAT